LLHRPRTSAGDTAPIFPIVIKCASEADAKRVAQLNDLLGGIHQSTVTRQEVANLFVRTPNDHLIDISDGPYYPVVIGHPVAIYHDWWVKPRVPDNGDGIHLLTGFSYRRDVDRATVGWAHPKWRKLNTVEEAIVYLVMKGKSLPLSKLDVRGAPKASSTPSKPEDKSGSHVKRQGQVQVRFEDMGNNIHLLICLLLIVTVIAGTESSTSAGRPKAVKFENALSQKGTIQHELHRCPM
jgi:hypothetical protein